MKPVNSDDVARADTFFVAGGTVPPGSPSYVERAADRELYDNLMSGRYCYVLNSRQRGKSSLAVRAVERLKAAGVRTAFVDLTRIGGATVTPEQWYAGLLVETGRAIGLRGEAVSYLKDQKEIGPAQRYLAFLHDVALHADPSPMVVMIDEIDAARSLPFSTDEFFAGIRQLYNGRASDANLNRLTFCLLGSALPSDLIRDARTTPFNIGTRIDLNDFTLEEVRPMAGALGPNGEAVLKRVMYWTSGHPFLTQALCSQLVQDPTLTVDQLVKGRYLVEKAQETDTNLSDVSNRLLGRGDPNVTDAERAGTLTQYSEMLKSGISDIESNAGAARIKMSGVARLDAGKLKIRNRIYGRVFGPNWVIRNMPGQDLIRQRRAYWLGVLRTAVIASVISAFIGFVAIRNAMNRQTAEQRSSHFQYLQYVASMRSLPLELELNNLDQIDSVLNEVKENPARDWEWSFWFHIAHRAPQGAVLGPPYENSFLAISGNGALSSVASDRRILIIDNQTGKIELRIPIHSTNRTQTGWFRDGRRLLVWNDIGWIAVYDVQTGQKLREGSVPPLLTTRSRWITGPGDREAVLPLAYQGTVSVNLDKLTWTEHPPVKSRFVTWQATDRSGDVLYTLERDTGDDSHHLCGTNLHSWKLLFDIAVESRTFALDVSDDGAKAALGTTDGKLILVDLKSGTLSPPRQVFQNELYFLSFSSDGSKLLVMGRDRAAKLLDVLQRPVRVIDSYRNGADGGILPDGSKVLVRYWDLDLYPVGEEPETPSVRAPNTNTGSISADGILYALGSSAAYRCDLMTKGELPKRVPLPSGQVDVSNPSSCAIVKSATGMGLYDLNTGALVYTGIKLSERSSLAELSPNRKYLAIAQSGVGLDLLALGANSENATTDFKTAISVIRFSPDSRYLVVGGVDGSVSLVSTAQNRVIWSEYVDSAVEDAAFSPDGTRLATCGDDDKGAVWNLADGRPICQLIGHAQTVFAIAWSPSGNRIATGSGDRTVRVWNPVTGEDLGIIGRHAGNVMSVCFLKSGRTLASFGAEGVAKLWMTSDKR